MVSLCEIITQGMQSKCNVSIPWDINQCISLLVLFNSGTESLPEILTKDSIIYTLLNVWNSHSYSGREDSVNGSEINIGYMQFYNTTNKPYVFKGYISVVDPTY